MKVSSMKLVLMALMGAMAVQGCRCDPGGGVRSKGEVRIIYTEGTTQVSGDNGIYDFGTVSMGKVEKQKLTVQNTGLGTLTIQKFEKTSGTAAKVGTFVDDPMPVFDVAFTEQTTVGSGESVEFDITYAPPVVEGQPQVEHETILTMTSGDVEVGKENATITLKGTAVSGECDLPATLDFGAVARGDTFSIEYLFDNPRPIETRGYLGAVESQQGDGIFVISPDSPKGEFLIAAMRSKTATFTFKPTEAREYIATVRMRRAEGCPEKPVRLIGVGVAAVLSWKPATLDFGYAPPNTTVEGEITFENLSLRDQKLTAMVTREGANPSNVFKIIETDQADLTTVTIPKGVRDASAANGIGINPGTVKVKLSFKPLVLGPRAGQLVATTELTMSQPTLSINLRGVGGGPDIDARPSPLNFGRIAYFANANPPSFATRKITVQNVGTRPTPADPRANLKLGQPDGAGGFTKPYWEVTPKNGATMDEICVGTFDSMTGTCTNDLPASGAGRYDPSQGLEAGGASSILDIPVRVTPNGLGMKEFEVKIFSNDPDEPVTTITVTANSVMLPPCDVEITPIALAFGIVSPPAIRDLGFTIRNRLNDICLVSNLQLLPETGTPTGMPAVFSLPGGPVSELELMGNQTVQVLVRAWPQGALPAVPAQVVGKVAFNVADPIAPQREISLTATIANSCLTISPASLNFGTVKKDCNSPNRNFQIYNSCTTDVVINSATMGSAAGESAGGPNCPNPVGGAPCPEFFVVSGIPGGTRVSPGTSTPVTFSLKYRPINYGADTGAFVINVTQAGQPLDYVVALQGTGDATGQNTDTFRQDSKPKADILLVIDDSCSMADKQTALSQNMASFLQYATSNQVDFQMAVTNTELTDPERGKFCSAQAPTSDNCPHGNKILRPTTPNLQTEFSGLVKVGTSGASESCMEPATRALTAPYITDPSANAGFLRQDAVLAVVCVTDARDQAPQAPAFYLNQLINIKGAQRSGQFTYNVVGPFLPSEPSGCSYDDPNDTRHDFMVSQTNGVKEEICTPNWAVALERIGKNAFGYRTNFFLTSRPDLSVSTTPITVRIDGMEIPATDPVLNSPIWEYDATNNSINFQPLYVPEPGKTMTVTYTAACIP